MEINFAFAKGFIKEFTPTFIANGSAMKFNWADFDVKYLQDLREKGYYDQHVQKWKVRNSSEGMKEESTDVNEDKAPKMTPLSHYSSHQGTESVSYFGSADLQPIKAAGEHLKKLLQDAKENWRQQKRSSKLHAFSKQPM